MNNCNWYRQGLTERRTKGWLRAQNVRRCDGTIGEPFKPTPSLSLDVAPPPPPPKAKAANALPALNTPVSPSSETRRRGGCGLRRLAGVVAAGAAWARRPALFSLSRPRGGEPDWGGPRLGAAKIELAVSGDAVGRAEKIELAAYGGSAVGLAEPVAAAPPTVMGDVVGNMLLALLL